jgi:glycosyltransferase 2 family protein
MKNYLLALKIVVSVLLIVFLSRKVSFSEAAIYLLHLQVAPTLLAFVLLGLSLALSGLRWYFASAKAIPLRSCLRYTWIAHLYGLILPGALSADVAKGVMMSARKESDRATLSSSIVLDRIAGLGSLLVFGFLSCLARPGFVPLSSELLIGLALLGGLGLIAVPWIARWFMPSLGLNTRLWFIVLLLSVAIHAVNITFYWVTLQAVGLQETWWEMGLYTCLLNLAMMLPVSIAGVGLRDQLSVAFLQVPVGSSASLAYAWVVLALLIAHGLMGLWFQWQVFSRRKSTPIPSSLKEAR